MSVKPSPTHDQVLLAVQDRGPGIPDDERERIFDRFYRGRDVRGRRVRGSGIGLSLCRHIARAHGGEVLLDSTPGQGSTFTVWIPAAKPSPDDGADGAADHDVPESGDPDAGAQARP